MKESCKSCRPCLPFSHERVCPAVHFVFVSLRSVLSSVVCRLSSVVCRLSSVSSQARKRKRAGEALVCNVKRTTFEGNSHEVGGDGECDANRQDTFFFSLVGREEDEEQGLA